MTYRSCPYLRFGVLDSQNFANAEIMKSIPNNPCKNMQEALYVERLSYKKGSAFISYNINKELV